MAEDSISRKEAQKFIDSKTDEIFERGMNAAYRDPDLAKDAGYVRREEVERAEARAKALYEFLDGLPAGCAPEESRRLDAGEEIKYTDRLHGLIGKAVFEDGSTEVIVHEIIKRGGGSLRPGDLVTERGKVLRSVLVRLYARADEELELYEEDESLPKPRARSYTPEQKLERARRMCAGWARIAGSADDPKGYASLTLDALMGRIGDYKDAVRRRGGVKNVYLNFEETLDALGIGEEELKRLVSTGEIRGFRDGLSMKFKVDDVVLIGKSYLTEDVEERLVEIGLSEPAGERQAQPVNAIPEPSLAPAAAPAPAEKKIKLGDTEYTLDAAKEEVRRLRYETKVAQGMKREAAGLEQCSDTELGVRGLREASEKTIGDFYSRARADHDKVTGRRTRTRESARPEGGRQEAMGDALGSGTVDEISGVYITRRDGRRLETINRGRALEALRTLGLKEIDSSEAQQSLSALSAAHEKKGRYLTDREVDSILLGVKERVEAQRAEARAARLAPAPVSPAPAAGIPAQSAPAPVGIPAPKPIPVIEISSAPAPEQPEPAEPQRPAEQFRAGATRRYEATQAAALAHLTRAAETPAGNTERTVAEPIGVEGQAEAMARTSGDAQKGTSRGFLYSVGERIAKNLFTERGGKPKKE